MLKYGGTTTLAVTSEDDCLRALCEAADRLGEPSTKAAYEELGLIRSVVSHCRDLPDPPRQTTGKSLQPTV